MTGEVTATDNCAGITVTQNVAPGTLLASGEGTTHTVTITVNDGRGNSVTHDVTLTGDDDTDPNVTYGHRTGPSC